MPGREALTVLAGGPCELDKIIVSTVTPSVLVRGTSLIANRGVYGAPRIHADLRLAHGIRVGRRRVERLMREAGTSGMVGGKRGRTTIAVPGVRVADDLIERQFRSAGPNQLRGADVTCLRTWQGWRYLAAVQDAYSRAIVG